MTIKPPDYVVFFVVCTSGEVGGSSTGEANRVLHNIVDAMRYEANRSWDACVEVAVLEYNTECKWASPRGPESLEDFVWEDAQTGGLACIGKALDELDSKLAQVRKGGFMSPSGLLPAIVFITSGHSDDDYMPALSRILKNKWFSRAKRIGVAVGKNPDFSMIAKLTSSSEAVFRAEHINDIVKRLKPSPSGGVIFREYEKSDGKVAGSAAKSEPLACGPKYDPDDVGPYFFPPIDQMPYYPWEESVDDPLDDPWDGPVDEAKPVDEARPADDLQGAIGESATIQARVEDSHPTRDLVVFYLLDRSSIGGGMVSFADRVMQETLFLLQAMSKRGKSLRVRVAALEFDIRQCTWVTPDGPQDIEDFAIDRFMHERKYTTARCNPGLALRELDSKLSCKEFLDGYDEFPLILVIVASEGHFNWGNEREFAGALDSLMRNEYFARSERFVFAQKDRPDVEILARLTRGHQVVYRPQKLQDVSSFGRFVGRLQDDPWWESRARQIAGGEGTGCFSLAETVELALWRYGDRTFCAPDLLQSFVHDYMDANEPEAQVLSHYCNKKLLEPFEETYAEHANVLGAVRKTTDYLCNDCYIRKDVAKIVSEGLALGISAFMLKNKSWKCLEYADDVDERLTVLLELEEVGENGFLYLIVLVRNNTNMTLQVDESITFFNARKEPVGNGWRYATIAPGDAALLCIDSNCFGLDASEGIYAKYSLMAKESPFGALKLGIETKRCDDNHEDGRNLMIRVQNNSNADAYVECLQVFETWYEIDKNDSHKRQLCGHWTYDPIYLRATLKPGDVREVRSACKGVRNGCEVFPVGCLKETGFTKETVS